MKEKLKEIFAMLHQLVSEYFGYKRMVVMQKYFCSFTRLPHLYEGTD